MQRPPPFLLRRRRRVAVAGGLGHKREEARSRGDLGGEPVGKFYRATGRHGPSDGGSAGADASRDAYAGRAQGYAFRCFPISFAQENRGKTIAVIT